MADAKTKYLTAGQVAKLAGVATRTVTKWSDKGLLGCHRLPISGDRRYDPGDVAKFLESRGISANGVPSPGPRPPARVVFVGVPRGNREPYILDGVAGVFADSGAFAGLAMASHRPAVVVVDGAVGRIEAAQTAAAARSIDSKAVLRGDGSAYPVGTFHAWGETPAEVEKIVRRLSSSEG